MKAILEQYFIEQGQLDLLSWGCLKLQKKQASFTDKGIEAPVESIQFEPIASTPSKHFYTFLADQLGISTDQAVIQYEQFIQSLFDGHQEQVDFESLGNFVFKNGILNWQSYFVSSNYYTDVHFNKLSNETDIEDAIDKEKDNWILMASIIGIISLLAILFKFYH